MLNATPRVLHVTQPTSEGVARVVAALAADQAGRGWQVNVACPTDGALAGEVDACGAEHHAWHALRSPGPSVANETIRLRNIIDRVRPDVVHLHSAKAGLAGRLAIRGRTPTVFQPHAWSFHATAGAQRALAARWECFAGNRWSDAVVCVSEDEAAQGRSLGMRAAFRVIPNGIPLGSRPAEHPQESDYPTALCIGRLCRQKGQDRVIDVWPEVRRRVPHAQLLLVGDGPDRAALEERARSVPGVIFVGNQTDVEQWIAASRLLVAPSRWEAGVTLACMEAMAGGRAIVATAFEGISDGLPSTCGAVVPHADGAALIDAVCARLTAPDLAAAEGAAAREHAITHYDESGSHAQVAALYAGLARDHARSMARQ